MKHNKKSFEYVLLIALFIFASVGTYFVFAGSSSEAKEEKVTKNTLYVKNDFSKYNTAKPKIQKVKAAVQE